MTAFVLVALPSMWITPVFPAPGPRGPGSDAFARALRGAPVAPPTLFSRRAAPPVARPPELTDLLSRGGPAAGDTARPESLTALGFRDDGPKRSLGRQIDLDGLTVNSKVVLVDPNWHPNVPLRRTGWKTEESLRLPVLGPVDVVGHVGATSDSVEWQQYEFVGKTGLAWRLLGAEFQLRGGRSLTNYDSDTELLIPEQARSFVELTTKVPLSNRLNLEYTRESIPAAANRVKQEVRLAMPLSNSGQFLVGARYRRENTDVNPWFDRLRMFIGLQLKH